MKPERKEGPGLESFWLALVLSAALALGATALTLSLLHRRFFAGSPEELTLGWHMPRGRALLPLPGFALLAGFWAMYLWPKLPLVLWQRQGEFFAGLLAVLALGYGLALKQKPQQMLAALLTLGMSGGAWWLRQLNGITWAKSLSSGKLFEWNADLSALSWAAHDEKLSLEAIEHKFEEIISKPKMNPVFVLFMASLANASFCRLFGGDIWAMLITFTATMVGFFTRQHLTRRKVNHYIVFIVSAFVASICASTALALGIETAEIALATSVLYLVPGVPLINGLIDITDGHIQIGISRFVNAFMLIICIAIGMSVTLMLVKDSLL